MDINGIRQAIESGRTALGIELGSTRIKAVLVNERHEPLASGGHDWENRLENGVWTYSLEDVWAGLQDSFQKLRQSVSEKYGVSLNGVGAIGVSAMMHGYLAFDAAGNLLAPFRTWRNTTTGPAAAELTRAPFTACATAFPACPSRCPGAMRTRPSAWRACRTGRTRWPWCSRL